MHKPFAHLMPTTQYSEILTNPQYQYWDSDIHMLWGLCARRLNCSYRVVDPSHPQNLIESPARANDQVVLLYDETLQRVYRCPDGSTVSLLPALSLHASEAPTHSSETHFTKALSIALDHCLLAQSTLQAGDLHLFLFPCHKADHWNASIVLVNFAKASVEWSLYEPYYLHESQHEDVARWRAALSRVVAQKLQTTEHDVWCKTYNTQQQAKIDAVSCGPICVENGFRLMCEGSSSQHGQWEKFLGGVEDTIAIRTQHRQLINRKEFDEKQYKNEPPVQLTPMVLNINPKDAAQQLVHALNQDPSFKKSFITMATSFQDALQTQNQYNETIAHTQIKSYWIAHRDLLRSIAVPWIESNNNPLPQNQYNLFSSVLNAPDALHETCVLDEEYTWKENGLDHLTALIEQSVQLLQKTPDTTVIVENAYQKRTTTAQDATQPLNSALLQETQDTVTVENAYQQLTTTAQDAIQPDNWKKDLFKALHTLGVKNVVHLDHVRIMARNVQFSLEIVSGLLWLHTYHILNKKNLTFIQTHHDPLAVFIVLSNLYQDLQHEHPQHFESRKEMKADSQKAQAYFLCIVSHPHLVFSKSFDCVARHYNNTNMLLKEYASFRSLSEDQIVQWMKDPETVIVQYMRESGLYQSADSGTKYNLVDAVQKKTDGLLTTSSSFSQGAIQQHTPSKCVPQPKTTSKTEIPQALIHASDALYGYSTQEIEYHPFAYLRASFLDTYLKTRSHPSNTKNHGAPSKNVVSIQEQWITSICRVFQIHQSELKALWHEYMLNLLTFPKALTDAEQLFLTQAVVLEQKTATHPVLLQMQLQALSDLIRACRRTGTPRPKHIGHELAEAINTYQQHADHLRSQIGTVLQPIYLNLLEWFAYRGTTTNYFGISVRYDHREAQSHFVEQLKPIAPALRTQLSLLRALNVYVNHPKASHREAAHTLLKTMQSVLHAGQVDAAPFVKKLIENETNRILRDAPDCVHIERHINTSGVEQHTIHITCSAKMDCYTEMCVDAFIQFEYTPSNSLWNWHVYAHRVQAVAQYLIHNPEVCSFYDKIILNSGTSDETLTWLLRTIADHPILEDMPWFNLSSVRLHNTTSWISPFALSRDDPLRSYSFCTACELIQQIRVSLSMTQFKQTVAPETAWTADSAFIKKRRWKKELLLCLYRLSPNNHPFAATCEAEHIQLTRVHQLEWIAPEQEFTVQGSKTSVVAQWQQYLARSHSMSCLSLNCVYSALEPNTLRTILQSVQQHQLPIRKLKLSHNPLGSAYLAFSVLRSSALQNWADWVLHMPELREIYLDHTGLNDDDLFLLQKIIEIRIEPVLVCSVLGNPMCSGSAIKKLDETVRRSQARALFLQYDLPEEEQELMAYVQDLKEIQTLYATSEQYKSPLNLEAIHKLLKSAFAHMAQSMIITHPDAQKAHQVKLNKNLTFTQTETHHQKALALKIVLDALLVDGSLKTFRALTEAFLNFVSLDTRLEEAVQYEGCTLSPVVLRIITLLYHLSGHHPKESEEMNDPFLSTDLAFQEGFKYVLENRYYATKAVHSSLIKASTFDPLMSSEKIKKALGVFAINALRGVPAFGALAAAGAELTNGLAGFEGLEKGHGFVTNCLELSPKAGHAGTLVNSGVALGVTVIQSHAVGAHWIEQMRVWSEQVNARFRCVFGESGSTKKFLAHLAESFTSTKDFEKKISALCNYLLHVYRSRLETLTHQAARQAGKTMGDHILTALQMGVFKAAVHTGKTTPTVPSSLSVDAFCETGLEWLCTIPVPNPYDQNHKLERRNKDFMVFDLLCRAPIVSYRIKNKKQFVIMVWSSTSKLTLEEGSFYAQVCGKNKNIQYPMCDDAALPARWALKKEVKELNFLLKAAIEAPHTASPPSKAIQASKTVSSQSGVGQGTWINGLICVALELKPDHYQLLSTQYKNCAFEWLGPIDHSNKAQLEKLKAEVLKLKMDVEGLSGRMNTHDQQIEQLIETIKAQGEELKKQGADHAKDVNFLKEALNNQNEKIAHQDEEIAELKKQLNLSNPSEEKKEAGQSALNPESSIQPSRLAQASNPNVFFGPPAPSKQQELPNEKDKDPCP